MKRIFFVGALLALLAAGLAAQGKSGAPSADEIIHKTVARAKWADEQKLERQYVFTRHTVREELNNDGSVKHRTDGIYQIVPITDRLRFARLVQKDGKPLSPAELKQEQEREKKARENVAQQQGQPRKRKSDDNEVKFDEQLVSRYHFQVIGREAVNGRPAFVLSARPKSDNLPVRRTVDRILNKLAGKLWIDEQDYEIARLDVYLTDTTSLWGGLAGTLRKLDLFIERTRTDDGVWLDSRVRNHIEGRLLFKSLLVKQSHEFSDFRKITPELVESLRLKA